jgi:hypothetical protein
MGVSAQGAVMPNGTDFWWDSFVGNTGNCWWGNTAASGKTVTTSPAGLPDCAGGTNPSLSVGTAAPANEAELVACLAGFDVSGYPNGNSTICTWTATPPRPTGTSAQVAQASAATTSGQLQALAEICGAGLAPRLCSHQTDLWSSLVGGIQEVSQTMQSPVLAATPVYTPGRLSMFTCDWWRQASANQKLGMVDRIQHFATMPINGTAGDRLLGYGAGMSTNRAALFLDDRCSMTQAGPFALYKLYGAAAAFAAVAQ